MTRDPEVKTLPSGQPVATFGIATNRTWNDKAGKKQQAAEFHNIVMFGRLAEIAKQYLSKGKSILIEGRLQTRTWDTPDGQKRNRTEIVAESMQLGPRGTADSGNSTPNDTNNQQETVDTIEYPHDEGEINPDEIPF